MVNYKKILQLASEEYTQRQIAASVAHSCNIVGGFLNVAKARNIAWPLEEAVTNEQIEAILFHERHGRRHHISGAELRLHPQRACKARCHADAALGRIESR